MICPMTLMHKGLRTLQHKEKNVEGGGGHLKRPLRWEAWSSRAHKGVQLAYLKLKTTVLDIIDWIHRCGGGFFLFSPLGSWGKHRWIWPASTCFLLFFVLVILSWCLCLLFLQYFLLLPSYLFFLWQAECDQVSGLPAVRHIWSSFRDCCSLYPCW